MLKKITSTLLGILIFAIGFALLTIMVKLFFIAPF